MEGSAALIDTPKRISLQNISTTLRGDLKDYERTFAANHKGKKPSKEDIKNDPGIAAKYKEYNKIRDILSGKLPPSTSGEAPHLPLKKRKSQSQSNSTSASQHARLPNKQVISTPNTKRLRPDELDPYDPPASVSPRPTLTAIGPTPQRDGKLLGIFDLLGSGSRSSKTPNSRKRKLDVLFEPDVADTPKKVATTAVQTQFPQDAAEASNENDLLQHLTNTPQPPAFQGNPSASAETRNRYSKTPVSESKKFMLSQFFATPSAVRYSSIFEKTGFQDENFEHGTTAAPTPLRDLVLGTTPIKSSRGHSKQEAQGGKRTVADATPAYLKRSFSFKQRLLSASSSQPQSEADPADDAPIASPTSQRATRKALTRQPSRTKFNPKPLSQIAAEIKQQQEEVEEAKSRERMEENEDDLDALREIENEVRPLPDVFVGDGQARAVNCTQEGASHRMYKKKGQKRQTRRVIMRPSRVTLNSQVSDTMVGDEASEEENVQETAMAVKTQLQKEPGDRDYSDDELQALFEDSDDGISEQTSKPGKGQKTGTASGKGEKPLGRPAKSKSKQTQDEDSDMGKINPNALSHMNFKSLKIKNKNSKARGGRFGGRGGGRFGKRRAGI